MCALNLLSFLLVLLFQTPCFSAGRTLNLYNAINADLDNRLASYMLNDNEFIKYRSQQNQVMPSDEFVGVMKRSLEKCGYDYSKTIYHNLRGKSYSDIEIMRRNGYEPILLPIISVLQEGKWESVVKKGYLSYEAVAVVADIYDQTQVIQGKPKLKRPQNVKIQPNNQNLDSSKLSEDEYKLFIRTSQEFRTADKDLQLAWNAATLSADEQGKKHLLNEQRNWLKSGRHEDALIFMRDGLDKLHAYIKAIKKRTNVLRNVEHNNKLSAEDIAAGKARPDDYYESAPDEDESVLPDNCGIVKASIPIDNNLYQIILDNGKGIIRTFYYYHQTNNESVKCGDIIGAMCFDILQSVPIPPKLRNSGIQGETMTIIHECRAAN